MLNQTPLSRFEISAYIMLVIGVIGDHFSTGIALTRENIYESNSIVLRFMQNGLWVPIDVTLIVFSVLSTYFLIRVLKKPLAQYLLIFPVLTGLIRLLVTFWNISLII